ncbi:MAG: gliding-associated putative transporter substrate-binding component GldG [Verrucomicrobia bacterium]|nr:gliding-associated putative transporter substrate-binding component GldG [Verrucomicrobiota bacterium]
MSMEPSHSAPSFSTGRRWFIGFHVLLAIVAVTAILVMVNYLSLRHFIRHDVSKSGEGQLTPTTLQVIKSLTNDVQVIIYFNPEEPLYPYVRSMLKEYAALSPHIKVRAVNYANDPAGATEIIAKYKLSQGSKDLVIFAANDRSDFVSQGQLSELDMSALMKGQSNEVKRKAFKGELFFTSKLLAVSSAKPYIAYYLVGHDEHDPQKDTEHGYQKFAELLENNNVKMKPLDLQRSVDLEVPADCDLLVIAGPRHEPLTSELERIHRYLGTGGRLLLLLNIRSQPGWEQLMDKWGVALGKDVVFDKPNMQESNVLMIENTGSHPITQSKDRIYMFYPRSVGRLPGKAQADSAQVTELLTTGPSGEARTDFRPGVVAPYPSEQDRKGVLSLAVAVEKGGLRNVALQRGATRMVVAGDSGMLNNQFMILPGNEEFARQSINWLLDRSFLLGSIGPRAFTEYQLSVNDSQMLFLRWIMLGAMPGGVFIFGLLVWMRRQQ